MDSRIGSIEKQKIADLTVVDSDMNIRKVFVRGREVFSAM
jgi:N-acetylglucosamine-6-phosphate deacetylase